MQTNIGVQKTNEITTSFIEQPEIFGIRSLFGGTLGINHLQTIGL